jgi:hypothetical protein
MNDVTSLQLKHVCMKSEVLVNYCTYIVLNVVNNQKYDQLP